MKKRTQIEAELAQLALEIGSKTNEVAAAAMLELYKNFAYLAAEETIYSQFQGAQDDLQAKLKARIAELQAQNNVEQVPTPAPAEPLAKATTTVEEDDNQLSLVDVAEEIEKEAAAKAAQAEPTEPAAEAAPVEEPAVEERTVFELDEEPAQETTPEAVVEAASPATENLFAASVTEKAQTTEKKSLNDRLAGGVLKFGLNDRIGFVKDLFDGSAEDFNRVVSQLNTLESLGEAHEFLKTHIAPEYNWAEHEETAERFMAAVEQRFS